MIALAAARIVLEQAVDVALGRERRADVVELLEALDQVVVDCAPVDERATQFSVIQGAAHLGVCFT
jgi:hypothetical protein